MSFTFDTKSSGAGTENPETVAHTCSSSTKVLVVGIAADNNQARAGSAPSYNSVTMTDSGEGVIDAINKVFIELWYLIDPDTGSSYDVSVPNTGTDQLYIFVASFEASGTVSKHASNSFDDNTANPSINVSTTVDNGLMCGLLGHDKNYPQSYAVGANYTEWYFTEWVTEYAACEYDLDWGSSGSIAVNWTESSDDWAIIGLGFEETAAEGRTTKNTDSNPLGIHTGMAWRMNQP